MRWALARVLLALAVAAGCGHAKTTDKGDPDKAATEPAEGAAEKGTEGKRPRPAPERQDPDAMPVAGSPEGLLAPGADEQIREKLEAGGYLKEGSDGKAASTREGIRRFQEASDLPATGTPDHMTVRKLGLDPDKVFRRQTVKD